ncbi:hypothetical protein BJX66DRAFT_319693 [Aspergillus keveii]|uniref:Uncharacterized protein n=1 Tax=Aspergillus keveii TaxID=714993 RepID=A0ABR4FID0_9EURO
MYFCGRLEHMDSRRHESNHKPKIRTSFVCGCWRKSLEFKVPGLETGAAGAGCGGMHVTLTT